MAYEKQIWVQYNPNLTYNDNYNNGAIVTKDKLNHMEDGIEKASLGGSGGGTTTASTKAEYYEDDPNNLITPGSYIVTPGSYTNVPDGNKNKYFVNVSSVTAFSANSQQTPDLQNLAVSAKSDKPLSITASIPQNSGFYTGTVIQVWHEIDLSFNTISTWLRTGSIVAAGTVTWSAYKLIPQSLADLGVDMSNYVTQKNADAKYVTQVNADAKYVTQISKTYSGDLNNLGTGGSYIIAPGVTNAPNATDYFFINVQAQGTTADYGVNQTATDIATGVVYIRTKATGHGFTPWSVMVTSDTMQAALDAKTKLVADEATAKSDSTNNPTISYVVPEAR